MMGKLSSGFALSYLDNEGDTVSITTDGDLVDAIAVSRHNHQEKVELFVHDPEKPPMPATLTPHPNLNKPLTPPYSQVNSRRRHPNNEDDEDEMVTPVKKGRRPVTYSKKAEEQVMPGIPNEMLLPGAIGALAVVIIGVFAGQSCKSFMTHQLLNVRPVQLQSLVLILLLVRPQNMKSFHLK